MNKLTSFLLCAILVLCSSQSNGQNTSKEAKSDLPKLDVNLGLSTYFKRHPRLGREVRITSAQLREFESIKKKWGEVSKNAPPTDIPQKLRDEYNSIRTPKLPPPKNEFEEQLQREMHKQIEKQLFDLQQKMEHLQEELWKKEEDYHEKWKNKFHEMSLAHLTEKQIHRVRQVQAQYNLGKYETLAMYANPRFTNYFEIDRQLAAELKEKVGELTPQFRREKMKLIASFHKKICETLPDEKEKLIFDLLWNDRARTKKGNEIAREKLLDFENYILEQTRYLIFKQSSNGLLELTDEQWIKLGDLRAEIEKTTTRGDLDLESNKRYRDQLLDCLLPHQQLAVAQYVTHYYQNPDWPLSVYRSTKFLKWAGVSAKEKAQMTQKSKDLTDEFDRKWKQLLIKYHNKAKSELPESIRERIQEVLGDPFLLNPRISTSQGR